MFLGSALSICEKQIMMPPTYLLAGIVSRLMSCLSSSRECPCNTLLPGSGCKSFLLLEKPAEVYTGRDSIQLMFSGLENSHRFLKNISWFCRGFHSITILWQTLQRHLLLTIFFNKQTSLILLNSHQPSAHFSLLLSIATHHVLIVLHKSRVCFSINIDKERIFSSISSPLHENIYVNAWLNCKQLGLPT